MKFIENRFISTVAAIAGIASCIWLGSAVLPNDSPWDATSEVIGQLVSDIGAPASTLDRHV